MNVIHLFTFRNLIFAKPLEMCKTLFENWTLQCWMHFLITSLDGSILWRVCENFLFTFERMREYFCCSNLVICLVSHDWFIFIVGENVLKCLIYTFFVYLHILHFDQNRNYFKAKMMIFHAKIFQIFCNLKTMHFGAKMVSLHNETFLGNFTLLYIRGL